MGKVRKLTGLLSYHRRYMKNFSRIAKPLYNLLKGPDEKGQLSRTWRERGKTAKQRGQQSSREPVKWTTQCQDALEQLITAITNPTVMAYPNYLEPFLLHTDASEQGLHGTLYQRQDGKLQVIAYGSCTLTAAERNYHLHSSKLEILALKRAITEQFRDYLYYVPHLWPYLQKPGIRKFNALSVLRCNERPTRCLSVTERWPLVVLRCLIVIRSSQRFAFHY